MLNRIRIALPMVIVIPILMVVLQPLIPLGASAKEETCETFPQTSRVVCGKFLSFWRKYGGLPIFGYPISNETTDYLEVNGRVSAYTVQYFERAVFELEIRTTVPVDVQLRRVGAELLRTKYPQGREEADLPLYPNAKVSSVSIGATPEIRITEYTTTDKATSVFAFYKDVLLKRGWRLVKETDLTLYISKDLPLGDSYVVYIETTPRGNGVTSVKLHFIYNPIM